MNHSAASRSAASEQGKLLLIAYHFGEGAETGAFRWNAMASDLVKRGWTIHVVTSCRPGVPASSTANGITTTCIPLPEWPSVVLRFLVISRRALALRLVKRPKTVVVAGDSGHPFDTTSSSVRPTRSFREKVEAFFRVLAVYLWSRKAAKEAVSIGRQISFSAIAVSSPPHQTLMAGLWASSRLNVPFIADLRDPWIFGHEPSTSDGPDRWFGDRFEARVFEHASAIVCNTPRAAEAARSEYPRLAEKITAIPNGYDGERQPAARPDTSVFRVVWAGTFYRFMDVPALIAACGRFRQRHESLGDKFRVSFMGCEPEFAGVPLLQIAYRHGLTGNFELIPKGTRAEATRLQESSAVLVCFDVPWRLNVAVKFYDYARMYGAILPLGFRGSALADAAQRLGIDIVDIADHCKLDEALDSAFVRWEAKDYSKIWDTEGYFARSRQSAIFHDLLMSCGSDTSTLRS